MGTHGTYLVEHANMHDTFQSSDAVARFLRACMVGWSHDLCDQIDALNVGANVALRTLYGDCTVSRVS